MKYKLSVVNCFDWNLITVIDNLGKCLLINHQTHQFSSELYCPSRRNLSSSESATNKTNRCTSLNCWTHPQKPTTLLHHKSINFLTNQESDLMKTIKTCVKQSSSSHYKKKMWKVTCTIYQEKTHQKQDCSILTASFKQTEMRFTVLSYLHMTKVKIFVKCRPMEMQCVWGTSAKLQVHILRF